MDIFLEFIVEIAKGMTRALADHTFQKFLNKNEKTTRKPRKLKGGSRKK